jgi:hypothetical protein
MVDVLRFGFPAHGSCFSGSCGRQLVLVRPISVASGEPRGAKRWPVSVLPRSHPLRLVRLARDIGEFALLALLRYPLSLWPHAWRRLLTSTAGKFCVLPRMRPCATTCADFALGSVPIRGLPWVQRIDRQSLDPGVALWAMAPGFRPIFPSNRAKPLPIIGRALGRAHDPPMMTFLLALRRPLPHRVCRPWRVRIFSGGCVAHPMRLTRMKCRPCSIFRGLSPVRFVRFVRFRIPSAPSGHLRVLAAERPNRGPATRGGTPACRRQIRWAEHREKRGRTVFAPFSSRFCPFMDDLRWRKACYSRMLAPHPAKPPNINGKNGGNGRTIKRREPVEDAACHQPSLARTESSL